MGISSYAWYIDLIPPNTNSWQWISTWKSYYAFDPVGDIKSHTLTPREMELVVGGEACMWGEQVDEDSIMERVWPKTAAVAERLWSAASQTDPTDFQNRLMYLRCHVFVQQMNLHVGPLLPDFCRRP